MRLQAEFSKNSRNALVVVFEPQDFTRPLDAEIDLLADGRNRVPLGLGAYDFPRITS